MQKIWKNQWPPFLVKKPQTDRQKERQQWFLGLSIRSFWKLQSCKKQFQKPAGIWPKATKTRTRNRLQSSTHEQKLPVPKTLVSHIPVDINIDSEIPNMTNLTHHNYSVHRLALKHDMINYHWAKKLLLAGNKKNHMHHNGLKIGLQVGLDYSSPKEDETMNYQFLICYRETASILSL